jgi:hypothetical protein
MSMSPLSLPPEDDKLQKSEHIILITNQVIFALSPLCSYLAEKQQISIS